MAVAAEVLRIKITATQTVVAAAAKVLIKTIRAAVVLDRRVEMAAIVMCLSPRV
jgi:hypothetical protein